MKKWPLLLLPLAVGAGVCTNSLVQAREPIDPALKNQAEFDAFTRQNPTANFDKLGHAFGNSQSRLFWNTDLEAAKRQAVLEGKPILALRLLGNLSDEYSCANSRFFRVIFYPQAQINERLRRDFVLYWSSERPVPVVTIDMGDGRVLKRTVTGNSAHYLLDSAGRPLDVFPGLATPTAFDSWLATSKTMAQEFKAQPQEKRGEWLANWHNDQLRDTFKRRVRTQSPEEFDARLRQLVDSNPLESTSTLNSVPARVAAPQSMGKMVVEAPLVQTVNRAPALSPSFTGAPVTDEYFTDPPSINLIQLNSKTRAPILDAATRARMIAMNPVPSNPSTRSAQNTGLQSRDTKDPLQKLIFAFETNLLIDTNRNQQNSLLIHALFSRGKEGNLDSLNRRIYDRLFLTPRSDQWLGLTSDTAFSALQNDGITLPTPARNSD